MPAGATVLYVRADAPSEGADGTEAHPFTSLDAALRDVSQETWVLLAAGAYRGSWAPRVATHLVGVCAARVTITGAGAATAATMATESTLDLRGLTIAGPSSGVRVGAGGHASLEGVVLASTGEWGLRVEGVGATVTARDVVVRNADGGIDVRRSCRRLARRARRRALRGEGHPRSRLDDLEFGLRAPGGRGDRRHAGQQRGRGRGGCHRERGGHHHRGAHPHRSQHRGRRGASVRSLTNTTVEGTLPATIAAMGASGAVTLQLADGVSIAGGAVVATGNTFSGNARFGAVFFEASGVVRSNTGDANRFGLGSWRSDALTLEGNTVRATEATPAAPPAVAVGVGG